MILNILDFRRLFVGRRKEMLSDLDSRSGSDRIDDVNAAGSAAVSGEYVAAVQREDQIRTAGQQRNQEEGKDRQQLQGAVSRWFQDKHHAEYLPKEKVLMKLIELDVIRKINISTHLHCQSFTEVFRRKSDVSELIYVPEMND